MDNRKWLTMDGNEAAAHASYAFTEVATIFPITSMSMSGLRQEERTSSGQKYRSPRCSPRQALQVLSTALLLQAL